MVNPQIMNQVYTLVTHKNEPERSN